MSSAGPSLLGGAGAGIWRRHAQAAGRALPPLSPGCAALCGSRFASRLTAPNIRPGTPAAGWHLLSELLAEGDRAPRGNAGPRLCRTVTARLPPASQPPVVCSESAVGTRLASGKGGLILSAGVTQLRLSAQKAACCRRPVARMSQHPPGARCPLPAGGPVRTARLPPARSSRKTLYFCFPQIKSVLTCP